MVAGDVAGPQCLVAPWRSAPHRCQRTPSSGGECTGCTGHGEHHQKLQQHQLPLGPGGVRWRGTVCVALGAWHGGWGGWPVFPRRSRLCGVCIFGRVLCVAPPSAARCTLVACRSTGSGVDSWRSPAGSRGALHEPHALDGVDLLDHRMALRPGGICAAPTIARLCQYKAARGI